jgi:sorbitol-6-phosphate 2-dehydrogenase
VNTAAVTTNAVDAVVRSVSPALRALLADTSDGPLKIITFEPMPPGDAKLEAEILFDWKDGEDDEALVARLRSVIQESEKRNGVAPKTIGVPKVGRFVVRPAQSSGRLAGKIAIVTGAAQGFGLEIAQGLAAEGAFVALADVNEQGVTAAARTVCEEYGRWRAFGLAMDVTNSESIGRAVDSVVRAYGGFDIFISNAGVLRAESVKTQNEKDFDFVTDVNYKGYFLCVQKAAPVMAMQHRANPAYWSDIIQINSKSGLAGSKNNFAYAGSKFGGIGLTQSFALELVDDGIKVNSVCPGNFLDGPLWSDPDRGLFVQYLRARKIPGAKTVADVKRAYEDKVPMRRGCTSGDVLKAIVYLIEQQYETGQALPVTGGQEMLR